MKVLVIHNYHRKGSASGDDQVFKNETSLLEKNNNEVIKFHVSNDDYDSASTAEKISYAIGMLWSGKYYKKIKRIIEKEKPDIVHVHTFSPLLSPSILYAVHRSGTPLVATLHDTRFICPCATSLRGTEICNLCADGHYLRMCKYKCYKESALQSFIMAMIFKYHRIRKSFFNEIDTYICLNDTQIKLLEENGYDQQKIVKKYNFLEDASSEIDGCRIDDVPDRYIVFYGRIGEEKGVRILMDIWDKVDIPLVVMGNGPMEKEFSDWAEKKDNVYFLGYTQHKRCLEIVKKAEFVLFPSIWYEGCSMVMIETQCLGKALIVMDIGFASEAITDGYDGIKVELGNKVEFIKNVQYLWENPDISKKMGENARSEYVKKYTPEKNYRMLIDIYKDTIAR